MSFLRSLGDKKDIDPSRFGVDNELLDLMYDLGIYGVVRSYFIHSMDIFDGYLAVKPKSERARLGLGLLALARPNFDAAIQVFRDDLLELNPKNDFARCYLGLAYKEKKMIEEAKECFDTVINANREESAVVLAKTAKEQMANE